MKKIILTIIFLIAFSTLNFQLSTPKTLAISVTPAENSSPTPTIKTTEPPNANIINELKDRIASRVAQLNLVERRGAIGSVTEVSDTQITVNDPQDNTRFIDVDELTKFSSPSAKEAFGISDISKGSKIGVLGLFNKQSKRLLARFVDILILPKSVHGFISGIDRENFTINITSEKGEETLADIETTTKVKSYTKEDGLIKSGFSKIQENMRVILIGFTDTKDKNRVVASRIILFPEIPVNQKIPLSKPATDTNEITPSIVSEKKAAPITR
ncbi:MAG: hypothetical protein Q7K55_03360 [Candidatus Levybacteria bacterium]|nr:hypothetical protein [Candidatus Levybacteria bacterium]